MYGVLPEKKNGKVRKENGKMIIVGYYFVECVLRETATEKEESFLIEIYCAKMLK